MNINDLTKVRKEFELELVKQYSGASLQRKLLEPDDYQSNFTQERWDWLLWCINKIKVHYEH